MAKQLTEEQIVAYADKEATDLQARFADWLIDKLSIEFKNKAAEEAFREGVRLATALRIPFQASDENQQVRESRAQERQEAEEERESERRAAEAAEAKAAAKPKGKVGKASKVATPAKDEEDAGDENVAPPARKTTARKASARSGAKGGLF